MSPSVTTPRLQPFHFRYLTQVESVTGYQPGGYHPVRLGDVFNDRYEIVHKLWYGSYSTVWLARDASDASYKALKIMAAEYSTLETESEILRHLTESDIGDGQSSPTDSFIVRLLDEFFIDGPNGRHRCLVTNVAGSSLSISVDMSTINFFPMHVARSIAARLVLAVEYIHSRGVAHGDLHSGNILLPFPSLDGLSLDEVYQMIGDPQLQPVARLNGDALGKGYPPYEVAGAHITTSFEKVTAKSYAVLLCDFGEAFFPATTKRIGSRTPTELAPPEALIDSPTMPLGLSSDIWTLACTIFEIFDNYSPFSGWMRTSDRVLGDVLSALGCDWIPPTWLKRWAGRSRYLDEDGNWINEVEMRPLEQRMKDMREHSTIPGSFSQNEGECFADMLRSMLKVEPEERVTAAELVESRWMREYGLPALRSCSS